MGKSLDSFDKPETYPDYLFFLTPYYFQRSQGLWVWNLSFTEVLLFSLQILGRGQGKWVAFSWRWRGCDYQWVLEVEATFWGWQAYTIHNSFCFTVLTVDLEFQLRFCAFTVNTFIKTDRYPHVHTNYTHSHKFRHIYMVTCTQTLTYHKCTCSHSRRHTHTSSHIQI